MTCIIGVKDNEGDVYIGGDSCISIASQERVTANAKVFELGDMLIGFSGYGSNLQILRYGVKKKLKNKNNNMDNMEYLVNVFAKACRKEFKEHDLKWKSWILIAYNGGLYEMCADFSVSEYDNDCLSVGIGYDTAMGAIESAKSNGVEDAEELIRTGLEVSAKQNRGVKPPFTIKKLKDKNAIRVEQIKNRIKKESDDVKKLLKEEWGYIFKEDDKTETPEEDSDSKSGTSVKTFTPKTKQ